ncbi:MAG: VWA domain-containing protein [Caldisericia bacterium]|nr:VWA domain-containing protein [Caldisericia bacterium]
MKKQLKNIVLLILIIFLLFPIVKLTANSVDNEFYISHIQSDKYPLTEVFFSLSNSKLSGLLNDKQLRLEEDGKTIQKFELHPPRVSRKPTSTVLVIDRSLSMKDSLSKAKESVSFYINQLTNFDQLSIISFSDKVEFLIKDKNNNPTFTSNYSLANKSVNSLNASGDTVLYDALYEGITLSNTSKLKDKAVIVLTDADPMVEMSKRNENDCIKLSQQFNIPVYCIGLGEGINAPPLINIAKKTGGEYFYAPTASQLKELYSKLSKIITKEDQFHIIGTVFTIQNSNHLLYDDFIPEAKKGISTYISKKANNDPISIIGMNNKEVNFSIDKSFLQNTLSSLPIVSNENIFDSLYTSIQLSKNLPASRRSIILLVCNSSQKDQSNRSKRSCINEAIKYNIPIYIIARGGSELEKKFVNIAKNTGGEYFAIHDSNLIPVVLNSLLDSFNQEYRITYDSLVKPTFFSSFISLPHRLKLSTNIDGETLTANKSFRLFFPNQKSPILLLLILLSFLCLIIFGIILIAVGVSKRKKVEVVKCPNCGSLLKPLDVSCPVCGYKTVKVSEGEETILTDDTVPIQQEEEKTVIVGRKKSLAWICIIDGENKGKVFDLKDDEPTSIGRNTSNDIVINDESVTEVHCKIFKNNNSYFIRDIASLNGTFLNNKRIENEELHDGDFIKIGETKFIFIQIRDECL